VAFSKPHCRKLPPPPPFFCFWDHVQKKQLRFSWVKKSNINSLYRYVRIIYKTQIFFLSFFPSFEVWPLLPTHCRYRGFLLLLITLNYTNSTIHATTHTQLHTLNYTHSTTHTQLYTLNYTHSTIYTQLHTLNYTHSTTHTQLYTLNYTHSTTHTQLRTLNYTHSYITQSVGLLWTRARPVAETRRPLPDNTHHSQETAMLTAEFEPAIPVKWAAADLPLRLRGRRARLFSFVLVCLSISSAKSKHIRNMTRSQVIATEVERCNPVWSMQS